MILVTGGLGFIGSHVVLNLLAQGQEVIIVDNLASGLAGAAFIAFLSSLTSVSFTAVQYAIFSSLMTLTPKILGGYSGTIVSNIGYPKFFLMTTLIGIPILVLVIWVAKLLRQHQSLESEHKGD